jgi:hypothetical protein
MRRIAVVAGAAILVVSMNDAQTGERSRADLGISQIFGGLPGSCWHRADEGTTTSGHRTPDDTGRTLTALAACGERCRSDLPRGGRERMLRR